MRVIKGIHISEARQRQWREERIFNLAWLLFWNPAEVSERNKKLLVRLKVAYRDGGKVKCVPAWSRRVYECYVNQYAPKR